MEYCIQMGLVDREEYLFLDALAEEMSAWIYPPNPGLLKLAPRITFQGELMNDLFQRYMKNTAKMIRLSCSDACRALRVRPGSMEKILSAVRGAAH